MRVSWGISQDGDIRRVAGRDRLLELVGASRLTFAIVAAVRLGLFRVLSGGGRDARELASAVGADLGRLTRLLEALEAGGALAREGDSFSLTGMGECLVESSPGTLAPLFELLGSDWHASAWLSLAEGLRSNRTPFALAHGVDLATYLESHPGAARALRRGYGSVQAPGGNADVATAIAVAIGDLGGALIVDVGGGDGTVLSGIALRNGASSAILLDRPVELELARRRLSVDGLMDRIELVAGDFFAGVPAGGDLYLLCFVLEDWADEDAIRVLSRCRGAIARGGRLLVVEEPIAADQPLHARLFDLETMVVQGGQERTLSAIEGILRAAGFAPAEVVPTDVPSATLIYADPA